MTTPNSTKSAIKQNMGKYNYNSNKQHHSDSNMHTCADINTVKGRQSFHECNEEAYSSIYSTNKILLGSRAIFLLIFLIYSLSLGYLCAVKH